MLHRTLLGAPSRNHPMSIEWTWSGLLQATGALGRAQAWEVRNGIRIPGVKLTKWSRTDGLHRQAGYV